MARENYVLLYGMVERNPDITVDEDAQYKKGKIILRTARKSFATEDNRFLQGEIRWDASKPDGTLRKLTDVSKLHALGWHHTIEIEEGVRRMYDWYLGR